MEPNKQGDAALSNPTADLEARLDAMRPDDPSSSPLLSPQHVPVPTAAPAVRAPPHMPQSPPRVLVPTAANVARPLQSQPHPLSWDGGESPSSSTYASHVGVRSQIFNAPAAPAPSVAQKPSKLNASAEEFRPIFLSHLSLMASPSTPLSSASQCQPSASGPRPGATAAFSARNDNASLLDQYMLRAEAAATSRLTAILRLRQIKVS